MNIVFATWLLCLSSVPAMAQLGLVENYEEVQTDQKIKSIQTMFYRHEDTSQMKGELLLRKDFNKDGFITEKYVYTFWDVVSYDHTTTYRYDSNHNLIEETKIQRILNLGKRDAEYIKALGDDPINEKTYYHYDTQNRLTKEVNYSFGKESLDTSKPEASSIVYTYDSNGRLIKEVGATPNGRITYENYIKTFKYDMNGNLVKEIKRPLDPNNASNKVTNYTYNKSNQLVEAKTHDSSNDWNDEHLKYAYDDFGNMTQIFRYAQYDSSWRVSKTFNFDKNGKTVFGDKDTKFTFYNNGLIIQQIWKSIKSNETVHFFSSYTFY